MQLLIADADFRAEAEFKSVRKPCRSVDVYARRVHMILEIPRFFIIFRHDSLGVSRTIRIDMRDRFRTVSDDLYRQDQIVVFRFPVGLFRMLEQISVFRHSASFQNTVGLLTAAQLHALFCKRLCSREEISVYE